MSCCLRTAGVRGPGLAIGGGALLQPVPGLGNLLAQRLPAGDLVGQSLLVVGPRGIGLFGLVHELLDLQLQLLLQFAGPLVTQGLVLRGVRFDVGAVDADRPDLQQLQLMGQFEHLQERHADRLDVVAAEGADGVVVRMGVRRQVAHCHIAVCGPLNAPGRENPLA